ncbi:MAG: hypothetical protein NTY74_04410 [Ignavibacteriae bacterium]|nr:hypothetical protein [Ignavibacteriota bacterium]
MINRVTKILFLMLITVSVAYAGLTFEFLTAKTNGDGILVEWKTGDESGTVKFEIERSASTPNSFIFVKSITANGSNSYYSFQDNGVDFQGKSGFVYYYRLKCITPNGSYSYTNSITVVHTVSGIKNTWGSIKAIFR